MKIYCEFHLEPERGRQEGLTAQKVICRWKKKRNLVATGLKFVPAAGDWPAAISATQTKNTRISEKIERSEIEVKVEIQGWITWSVSAEAAEEFVDVRERAVICNPSQWRLDRMGGKNYRRRRQVPQPVQGLGAEV